MATLTETAFYTRRYIQWLVIAMVGYVILRMFWGLFVSVWISMFPPKMPLPTNAFGKLPALVFPEPLASPSGTLTLRLETIEGAVPSASPSATIYFMPKTAANLLVLSRAQELAQRMQFATVPIQETKNIYRFEDAELPLRRLRYDIVSSNFIVRYGFEQDPLLFTSKNVPLPQAGIMEARNIMQTYGIYPDDIAKSQEKVTFLKLQDGKLISAISHAQADALRVDFFRNPIGEMHVLTPYPSEAGINFIFSGSVVSKKHILQLAYTYWPIDYDTSATYALKTSQKAWEELTTGKGYFARLPSQKTQITIRNVYLAYYDSYEPQTYLQPIFVFEGDDGFLAYVPAVSPEWTE